MVHWKRTIVSKTYSIFLLLCEILAMQTYLPGQRLENWQIFFQTFFQSFSCKLTFWKPFECHQNLLRGKRESLCRASAKCCSFSDLSFKINYWNLTEKISSIKLHSQEEAFEKLFDRNQCLISKGLECPCRTNAKPWSLIICTDNQWMTFNAGKHF